MMRKLSLCAALVVGCNPITNPTPTRSLDRPSDVALVCAVRALNGDAVLAPLAVCDYSASTPDNLNTPDTAPDRFLTLSDDTRAKGQLFAFVSNTTRGEVALVANGTREFTADDPNRDRVRQVVALDPNTQVATNLGGSIIDLDNASPGYGFIPVGGNPERIRATDDGCVAVTTNVDSCDLALVDVQALLRKLNGQTLGASTVLAAVRRVVPRARDVGSVRGEPLRARPTWIEFTADTTGLGTAADRRGNQCSATAGYRAFVAFPGCSLVGEMDLRTGELIDALQFTPAGAVRVAPEDVRCPVECTGAITNPVATGAAPGVETDDAESAPAAGAGILAADSDSEGLGTLGINGSDDPPPILPRTLAVDGVRRLYVGDARSDAITVVDLGAGGNFGAVRPPVLLAPGGTLASPVPAGGVTVMRLSPLIKDPYDASYPGTRFLYAIARDRTVRVIDAGLDAPYECETNPDGRILNQRYRMIDVTRNPLEFVTENDGGRNNGRPRWPNLIQQTLRCLPIGPQTPRSPLSRSPGILLPGAAVPRDITFTHGSRPADATENQTAPAANPILTVGDFAWIIGSSGRTVVVSLYDACPQPNVPQGTTVKQSCVYLGATTQTPDVYLSSVTTARANTGQPTPEPIEYMPHRIRNSNGRFDRPNDLTNPADGAARLAVDQSTLGGSPFDIYQTTAPFLCDFGRTGAGEQLNLNLCVNTNTSPLSGTLRFYDSVAVRNEAWNVTWEGLVQGGRPAGVLSGSPTRSTLSDVGAGFCSRAVRPGDKVDLLGCTVDTDCQPWQRCYRDPAAPLQAVALCVSRDPATYERAITECQPWTRGVLRYRIREARSERLELQEITEPENPLNTHECAVPGDNTECSDVVVLVRSNNATVSLPTTCLPDGSGVNRCQRACRAGAIGLDGLCGPGFICAQSQSGRDLCLRAPLPTERGSLCFSEPQAYQVRAGDTFLVTSGVNQLQSSEEGRVDPQTGLCELSTDPGQRYLQSRIPLDDRAMVCPPDVQADWLAPLTNLPEGNYSNVCRIVTPPPCTNNSQCGTGGTCLLESRTCLGNRVVRFSNSVLEAVFVVPPRPLTSIASGPGVPVTYNRVPAIDAQVSLSVTGGFSPLSFLPQSAVGRTPQLFRSIVVGPDRQTIYIVDEGRENVTTGLRGQLLRFYTSTKASDTSFNIQ